jgi:hypothetical protein
MKSLSLICFCTILLGTMVLAQSNPVPLINNPLVPDATTPGGASFTLTVNGTGFVPASTVNWNGVALATTFVSESQLTATIPAANIATASTASVTVVSPAPGGGKSNVDYFDIRQPFTAVGFGQSSAATGTGPFDPLAVDLNNDGKLDIVNLNASGSYGISVLLGNGDGTFQPPVGYNAPNIDLSAFTLFVGDFSNDGILDLVVAESSGGFYLLLGNGDGTFQPAQSFTIPGGVGAVSAGDFNGDGNLDLAFTIYYPTPQVIIVPGNGNGTFQNWTAYTVGSGGSHGGFGLATGDFNKDGKLDLAVTVEDDNKVAILLGNGDGTFQAPTHYRTGSGPEGLTVADLNGDGILDLAVQDDDSNNNVTAISVLFGNGDGTFARAVNYSLISILNNTIAAADLNGDDILDLIVPGVSNLGEVVDGLLGNGDGTFQSAVLWPAGNGLGGMSLGDFNNDGLIDLVTAGPTTTSLSVLLQATSVISPTLLNFKQVTIGRSATLTSTLSNIGSSTFSISRIALSGRNRNVFKESNTCGQSLAPGTSCTITIVFKPLSAKSYGGVTVQIGDGGADASQTIYLEGSGVN